ncbi:dimethylsulfonioproprionate lyase family protein [Natranaerobius trueperi]|uniref:Cupin 2 conserved barrel domain-containing protein n=1 Tax=Natranaerobius trueperi TaxID=759412 RepID=A0A226C157_9FIRM|nr:dimethylsulfonioproprionate lyase family protein [Natranaerobius trueperi]OWZ84354.1 hypothetical protein CDO51_03570 [Natranaerobius trueperi]
MEDKLTKIINRYWVLFSHVPTSEEKMHHHIWKTLHKTEEALTTFSLLLRSKQTKPVCNYLENIFNNYQDDEPLLDYLKDLSHLLTWEFGYDELPDNLKERYAFAELLGPRGMVISDELILGLVLLAPNTYYPRHRHPNITETYICLYGSCSIDLQNQRNVLQKNDYLFVPKGNLHAIFSDKDNPCLLAYAWTSDAKTLKTNQMKLESY